MNHERWIWTELIGFDTRQPDLGVRDYLETAGFVPAAICLLLSHVDFVLQHAGMASEIELAKDICSTIQRCRARISNLTINTTVPCTYK